MISTKLLPRFFKDVLQHIPTLALKSIDWKDVLKSMGPMVLKLGENSLDANSRASLEKLQLNKIKLRDFSPQKVRLEHLPEEERIERGQVLLELYFQQLKNPEGLILDLRSKYFKQQEGLLWWSPNNTWYRLSSNFREALINIYSGFYFDDQMLFTNGLSKIGLTEDLSQSESDELKQLFYQHFGPGDQDMVKFKLEEFSESFYHLFHFFVEKKVQLHKDFIFLGIYLVTLYMHLEELNVELDVREAFNNVFKPNSDD